MPLSDGVTITDGKTRFHTLAVIPGGKPRDQALSDARQSIKALSGMAMNLVRSNTELLRQEATRLAATEAAISPDMFDLAFDRTVEIAEVASFFDLTAVGGIARSLSELLVRMRSEGRFRPDSFNVHVEALKMAMSETMEAKAAEVLVTRLRMVVDQLPDPEEDARANAATG